jgi:hypothetical protein
LGIIRLGHKEKKTKYRADGSSYTVEFPVQDDHFVLSDAPELMQIYGETPRALDVILPFPDVNRNFDAAYTVWAGGVLVCRGDGEYVEYAAPFEVKEKEKRGRIAVYNAPGDTLVTNGTAQSAFAWNGERFSPGDLVPCSGATQDLYPHCQACRMSAILKVMMADPRLFRLGYYQIATGSGRNYDTILGTLELIQQQAGRVNGIPFKLRLVEESTTYQDESGKRRQVEKWFLQLEPDPDFTRRLYRNAARSLVSGDDQPVGASLVDAPSLVDGPQGQAQGVAPTGVIQDEDIVAEEPAPPPAAPAQGPNTPAYGDANDNGNSNGNGSQVKRPADANTVRGWLRTRAGWQKNNHSGRRTGRAAAGGRPADGGVDGGGPETHFDRG